MTDPLVEDLWQIKDNLSRESGYDTRCFFNNLRKWGAEHSHPGPMAGRAEELRRLSASRERQRAEAGALVLNDKQTKPN